LPHDRSAPTCNQSDIERDRPRKFDAIHGQDSPRERLAFGPRESIVVEPQSPLQYRLDALSHKSFGVEQFQLDPHIADPELTIDATLLAVHRRLTRPPSPLRSSPLLAVALEIQRRNPVTPQPNPPTWFVGRVRP
jgi:hypothetical protein